MQDDRDREQQASPDQPPNDDTPEAEPRADAGIEPVGGEEAPAGHEPAAAAAADSAESAESADEFETAPGDWPAADADAVRSAPEPAADEPPTSEPTAAEREAVDWPDEPPSPQLADEPAASPAEEPASPAEEPTGPPPEEAEAYPAVPPPAAEAGAVADAGAHSVPAATQIGESTQCPRCGTENRPGVAFCRNCGQRLVAAGVATTVERPGTPEGTQQCPRCGTHNRAGVAFCQNCGANLRVTATPAPGYVPPAAPMPATAGRQATAEPPSRGGAVLGPIVLLVGGLGMVTAWLLPFMYGGGSLWDRSFGSAGGYGVAFWNSYSTLNGGLPDQAYFGFAAAAPILVAILLLLAVAGFLRAAPGGLQLIGLLVALLWALGLAAAFLVIEVGGNWHGDIVDLLRALTPAGIIFLLASLIVVIGAITRLARS